MALNTFNPGDDLLSDKVNENFDIISKKDNGDYFGDGSDGDVTIDSDTTLDSDKYYNNLTIEDGVTLKTGGYQIFVKGTLTQKGTIDNSDGDGGTLMAATPGGGAGNGGSQNNFPAGDGQSGFSVPYCLASIAGGRGGRGGEDDGKLSAGGYGHSGDVLSVEPITNFLYRNNFEITSNTENDLTSFSSDVKLTVLRGLFSNNIFPPAGSGGGGGGGAEYDDHTGANGGAGGKSGGIIYIAASTIDNQSTGTISSNGSNGSNGNDSDNVGAGGGGGGGAGGIIVLVYSSITDNGSINVSGGSGGSGGNKSGTYGIDAEDGSDGDDGAYFKIKV